MARPRHALAAVAVVVGVAAEAAAYDWDAVHRWLPDLVVGWTFVTCGLVAWSRRSESRTGLLLAATGFAWFAGNFAESLVYLHRGPLVHCVLAYPHGRLRSRLGRAAVALAYAAAVAPPLGRSEAATVALAAVIAGVAVHRYATSVGGERRARADALRAASVLALVLVAGAAGRLAIPDGEANAAVLLAYEGALVAVALALVAGLTAGSTRASVTDLVVELGEQSSGTLRDALARALGDPTLRIGYPVAGQSAYVDAAGERVDLPGANPSPAVTLIQRDGQPLAVLLHDRSLLEDPGLIEGVAAAARLAAVNARLQGEIRVQLADLEASRRRLLEAGDEERRRLELRLREGAARRLEALEEVLAGAASAAVPPHDEDLAQARRQLARALDDLHELARGLHPRELAERGLGPAIAGLAGRSAVPVEVDVSGDGAAPEAEAAAYFLCSEALANVAKYASASRAAIRITQVDATLRVEVEDDGRGGADPASGLGLRGLADRVEALGGSLRVESPRGCGTRLAAVIPVGPRGRIDR